MLFRSFDDKVLSAYSKRPGLTGASQVSGGRSQASWEKIFEEDLKYSEKITFWKDLKIIFKTIAILFKSEASAEGAKSSKREYYYADYLFNKNIINAKQYSLGLLKADDIIKNKGRVDFQKELHS